MARFNVGDKIYNKEEPNKIYKVVDINTVTSYIPNYTLYNKEEGYTFESFCLEGWHRVVTSDEALRYGEVLTDEPILIDQYYILNGTPQKIDYVRIRTIRYDERIFYHKMMNGEVIEFKELTA